MSTTTRARNGLSFGPALGDYLKFKKIKQKTVGEACLLSKQQMSKSINGYHALTTEDAYEIVKFLGVSLEFIMEEKWKHQ